MQRILLLLGVWVLSVTHASAQEIDFQGKSKAEIIAFIKESIETHANIVGIDYKVSYNPDEPGFLRIGEEGNSDFNWYKVDLTLAEYGKTIEMNSTGKDNFVFTFKKDITIKEKNGKKGGIDVFFFRKKDKRETDYSVLMKNLENAFKALLEKSRS